MIYFLALGFIFLTSQVVFSSEYSSYSFPKDHFAHQNFKVEWWYYNGHLDILNSDQKYGFELTFFSVRFPKKKQVSKDYSHWKTPGIYLSHFAISDKNKKKFFFNEKINRPIGNIAGESYKSFHLWNENWSARIRNGLFYLKATLQSQKYLFKLNLILTPLKPPIIHGLNGLSLKGPEKGNHSHYYSITRLKIQATITINYKKYSAKGFAWMDHEWMNNQYFYQRKNKLKWDWFSLQLNNNIEIMFYILRSENQKTLAVSSGTIVDSYGKSQHLFLNQVSIQPLEYWRSKASNLIYPIQWSFELQHKDKTKSRFLIKPYFKSQELDTKKSSQVIYWEGAVNIKGEFKGQKVMGQGYVEMTGYDKLE